MTYDLTNYLRGIAIIIVIINHYINQYTTYDIYNYANAIIAIFFILSGYGLYYSLNRRFNREESTVKILGRFYLDRIIRIYPLYYITIVIGLFILDYNFNISILSIFGLEWIGKYWFIVAIIHCYFFVVPLYYLLLKIKLRNYLIVVTYIFLIINIVQLIAMPFITPYSYIFVYRSLLFSHIFLFAIGLSMPQIINKIKHNYKVIKKKNFYLFCTLILILFCLTIHFTSHKNFFNSRLFTFIIFLLFIFSSFIFVFYLLFNYDIIKKIKLPFSKFFITSGIISLPLYLFHDFYFKSIYYIEFIKNNPNIGILIVICMFPILFYSCIFLNKISTYKLKFKT